MSDEPQPVSVTEGSVFRVGDVIRIRETGQPLEVRVVSARQVFFVRLPRWRRVWLWARRVVRRVI